MIQIRNLVGWIFSERRLAPPNFAGSIKSTHISGTHVAGVEEPSTASKADEGCQGRGAKANTIGASSLAWSQAFASRVSPRRTMTRSRDGTIATICWS